MSEIVPGESIVQRINVAILVNFTLVCEKVCNLWFPENPWVKEERAVEQIVMRGWRFLVETCFKEKYCIEEAVDAWENVNSPSH